MPPKSSPTLGMSDTWGRQNRRLPDATCATCGALFRPRRSSSKFCSRPCMWKQNGGKNRIDGPTWWKTNRGYIVGRIWVNGKRVHIKQHRWVVQGIIGRPLLPDEDVHHLNGVKDDNRPENLSIVSHGDHSRITNLSREYKVGYSLNLTDAERYARSLRAVEMGLSEMGRAARTTGESK